MGAFGLDAVLIALCISLFAGLTTGFGGLIAALKKRPDNRFLAGALGLSAGVMIYISLVELLPEGIGELAAAGWARAEVWGTVAFFAGIAVIAGIDRLVPEEINPHEEPPEKVPTPEQLRRVGLVTALAIAVHNFPEGFATFFVAVADPVIAVPIALAIAIHNIPEGIAVAVPIREATGSRRTAVKWATLSGLAEPLGALVGYLILAPFITPALLGLIFAAIAGIMVFVSVDKLLPTAIQAGHHHMMIYGLVAGMAVMAVSLLLMP